MAYEVGENRLTLDVYSFEMDTRNNIHVYAKGMRYFGMIENRSQLELSEFSELKYKCQQWLVENK
ncbi:hypothetical protein [Clostridium sulfidigenes]|uniref:hypothetical protein n=1 Tax=Clostridium sulfidigenes TaxID=318464 RepID=UPI003F8AD8F7